MEFFIHKNFIKDMQHIIPNCPDEDINFLWLTGEINDIADKHNLSNDDAQWLKSRRDFFFKSIKNLEKIEKEYSLFNIFTFGLFK